MKALPLIANKRSQSARGWAVLFAGVCISGLLLAGCVPRPKGAALALEKASPQTRALLEKIPAENAEQRQELDRALMTAPDECVRQLCAMVAERGKGDDSKVRKALYGMTMLIAAQGQEARRAAYARLLAEPLDTAAPNEVKAFMIGQLRLVAGKEAIAPLGRLLTNKDLCDDASQALLSIHEGVAPVFRAALPKATDACLVTIIGALGDLRDEGVAQILLPYAKNEKAEVRTAALRALANIGDLSAMGVLKEAAEAGRPRYERSQTAMYLVLFAQRLVEKGQKEEAARICRDLLKSKTPLIENPTPDSLRGESQIVAAALRLLAQASADTVFGDLSAAMQSKSAQVRGAAVDIAMAMKGPAVTANWLAAMKGASPSGRAAILILLALRGDKAAFGAASESLKDADATVRLAAIGAAAKLGGIEAVAGLVESLGAGGRKPQERQAVEDALVLIPGAEASAAVAKALDGASAELRASLIRVLDGRRASEHLKVIFVQAKDKDESVRIAALKAIGDLAGEQDLPALLKLLAAAKSDAERAAAEQALGAVCRRVGDAKKSSKPVLAALSSAKTVAARCSLLRVLGQIGGADALKAVRAALREPKPEVKDAAVRALADWLDAEPATDLLDLARKSPNETHRVLALRGYLRVVALPGKRPAAKTLEMLDEGMKAAARVDEKKMALAGMGAVKDAQALAITEAYLGDEALRQEAVAATLRVAKAVAGSDPREAASALDKVAALSANDEATSKQVREIAALIEDQKNVIPEWEVSGPYTEKAKEMEELFDVVFAPEEPEAKDAKDIVWKTVKIENNPGRPNRVDLDKAVGGENRVAYMRVYVWSPKDQKARLECGSDDGVKAWLNGEVVLKVNKGRSFMMAEDKAPIQLKNGWNELMLKVTNGGADWEASARVRSQDGKPLGRVRAQVNKDEPAKQNAGEPAPNRNAKGRKTK